MTFVSNMASGAPKADLKRQTIRLGANYLLQAARLVAEAIDRDLIKALLILAISRANVSAITESPGARTQYAGLATIPPDTMRLPISAYALARDMRLPYETVRRHVGALKKVGLCVGVAGGLIVPGLALANPRYLLAIDQNWSLTTDFVDELGRFGVTATRQADAPRVDIRRQTVRISVDYFIDGLCLLSRTAGVDLVDVLLLCAVSVSNVEHMAQDLTLGATSEGLAAFVHGHCRRPVRVNAVAASLLLPYETARRRTNNLLRLGLIERRAGEGVVVPSSVVARPNMEAGLEAFATLTEGFLARLAKIGVTRRDGVAVEPEGAHRPGPARRGYQGCSS